MYLHSNTCTMCSLKYKTRSVEDYTNLTPPELSGSDHEVAICVHSLVNLTNMTNGVHSFQLDVGGES